MIRNELLEACINDMVECGHVMYNHDWNFIDVFRDRNSGKCLECMCPKFNSGEKVG